MRSPSWPSRRRHAGGYAGQQRRRHHHLHAAAQLQRQRCLHLHHPRLGRQRGDRYGHDRRRRLSTMRRSTRCPAAQSTNEDTTLVFSSANGNRISIGDFDDADNDLGGDETLMVTLASTKGVMSLGSTGGLAFSAGDGTADASMTFSGTLGDINNALNGLGYLPTLNSNGSASLSITTDDLGNFGTGGALHRQRYRGHHRHRRQRRAGQQRATGTNHDGGNDPRVLHRQWQPASPSGDVDDADNLIAGDETLMVSLASTNGAMSLGSTSGLAFSTRRRHCRRHDDLQRQPRRHQQRSEWLELCRQLQFRRLRHAHDHHQRSGQLRHRRQCSQTAT